MAWLRDENQGLKPTSPLAVLMARLKLPLLQNRRRLNSNGKVIVDFGADRARGQCKAQKT